MGTKYLEIKKNPLNEENQLDGNQKLTRRLKNQRQKKSINKEEVKVE